MNFPLIGRGGALSFDEFLPPESEIQQEPGIPTPARPDQLHHRRFIEEIGLAAKRRKFALRKFAELTKKPFVDRNPKPLLPAIDNLIGYDAPNRFLQDVL